MNALATFTNAETGMTALVFANHKSGFNVTVRDDDSGEFVNGVARVGIATPQAAIEKAKEILN